MEGASAGKYPLKGSSAAPEWLLLGRSPGAPSCALALSETCTSRETGAVHDDCPSPDGAPSNLQTSNLRLHPHQTALNQALSILPATTQLHFSLIDDCSPAHYHLG